MMSEMIGRMDKLSHAFFQKCKHCEKMEAKLQAFCKLFQKQKGNIIGMIHLKASPGTPQCSHSVNDILKQAVLEASLYQQAGVDSVLVENMHDIPYLHTCAVGPEVVATMTMTCSKVREAFTRGPVGVQVLAGANEQALAIAQAAGLDYIRAEGFVFSHVADEGLMNACAGPLLRYRKHIGADNIQIFTDIKKKHSAHSVTADVSIAETAKAAEFFLSDGVIVTGSSTNVPADTDELKEVQDAVSIPVLVGSGVTLENYSMYKTANALIIGSYFKHGHHWSNDINATFLNKFMDMVRKERG